MANKKENKVNTSEDKIQEWDSSEWQGRTQAQVEGNNRILHYVLIAVFGLLWGWGLVKLLSTFM